MKYIISHMKPEWMKYFRKENSAMDVTAKFMTFTRTLQLLQFVYYFIEIIVFKTHLRLQEESGVAHYVF